MQRRLLLAIVITSSVLGAARADEGRADLVYRGGRVYTLDAQDRVAQALAIRGGKIVYVGDDAGAAALVGPKTRLVELEGKMLMPGLVDAHMHPGEAGAQLLLCNLAYEPLTIEQFQARIQACLDRSRKEEPDGWLHVVNWFQQNMQPPGTAVTRATLDALKTRRPIFVESSFGHSSLANSRALARAKIDARTADPTAGRINRAASGEPTGLLEDEAQHLVADLLPKPTPAQDIAAAKAALEVMRKQGVTSFLDAAASEEMIAAFGAVRRQGGLTARAHFAPVITPEAGRDPKRAVAEVRRLALRYDQGPLVAAAGVTVRNAKLFLDGVITAPAFTSRMLTPYFTNQGTSEQPRWAPGTNLGPPVYFAPPVLSAILLELGRAGLEPHLHADGEAAVRAALDAIEALRKAPFGKSLRAAIAHADLMHPDDFPRFARVDAVPVLSFQWDKPAPDSVEGARDFLGPERWAVIEPAGLLVEAGARIAFGSDWPVDPLDEWYALQVGVTRENGRDPKYPGRLGRDPGLSRVMALRGATMNAAYALHRDAELGSLEVGKWGDLIVLDRGYFEVPAQQIAQIRVLQTVVGGKVVYEAR